VAVESPAPPADQLKKPSSFSKPGLSHAFDVLSRHSDRGRLRGESDEFKRLRRAIDKAHGDRERAIAFVCRLYNVRTLDALPSAIRAAVHALLDE
jgi:hypothetical protein